MHFAFTLVLVLIAGISGCAVQSYSRKPLAPEELAREYSARSANAPGLRTYMLAQGLPEAQWPIKSWGLKELTLLAFYYHPDLDVARAKLSVAEAGALTARQRSNPLLKVSPEHHSRTPDSESPWTLGFELEIPSVAADKKQARAEQAGYLAQAAAEDVRAGVWQVRSRLRARFLDYYAALKEREILRAEYAVRNEMAVLLERRFDAGMASAIEVSSARINASDLELRLRQQDRHIAEAVILLADALGLPPARVRELNLSFAGLERPATVKDAASLRSVALTNRADIRRALHGYAAAEAALKLEIARQYPDIVFKPGYTWDQGDNRWLLGVALPIPVLDRNEGPILEASAKRELAARNFIALQGRVITQIESALAGYQQAREGLAAAEKLSQVEERRSEQVERRFAAGDIDRLERVLARLDALTAERAVNSALVDLQRTAGLLEDAVQRPLDGSSMPVAMQSIPRSAAPALQ